MTPKEQDIIANLPDNRLRGLIVAHRNRPGWCSMVRFGEHLLPFTELCAEQRRRQEAKRKA